jgi:hypothetical protein
MFTVKPVVEHKAQKARRVDHLSIVERKIIQHLSHFCAAGVV